MNPEPLVQEPAPKPKKSMEERNRQRVKVVYENAKKTVDLGGQVKFSWILKNISDSPIPQGTIPTRKGGDQLDCKGEPL